MHRSLSDCDLIGCTQCRLLREMGARSVEPLPVERSTLRDQFAMAERDRLRAENAELSLTVGLDRNHYEAERDRSRAPLLAAVPQTFGEALTTWPWLTCAPHEWDNRTTEENAAWLLDQFTSRASTAIALEETALAMWTDDRDALIVAYCRAMNASRAARAAREQQPATPPGEDRKVCGQVLLEGFVCARPRDGHAHKQPAPVSCCDKCGGCSPHCTCEEDHRAKLAVCRFCAAPARGEEE